MPYKNKLDPRAIESSRRKHQNYYVRNRKTILYNKAAEWGLIDDESRINKYINNDKHRFFLKLETICVYSNGTMKCVMCGEHKLPCLSIDHIYGGGNKHRRQLKVAGVDLYRWLRRNKYPDGYRVLCANCQSEEKTTYELEKEIDESGIEAHQRDHPKGNKGRIFEKPSGPDHRSK